MFKLLVTGSTGFIGSTLVPLLREAGHDVHEIVRYVSGGRYDFYHRQNRYFADLRDRESLEAAVRQCKPDIIINLAAQSAVSYSFVNPIDVFETNTQGIIHLARAAMEVGVKQFLQASTSEVYGNAERFPITEDTELHPTSPYAISKIAAETHLILLHQNYGFPVTVLRPFNSVLPGETVLVYNDNKPLFLNIEEAHEGVTLPCFIHGKSTILKPSSFLSHRYCGDAYTIETFLGKKVRVTGDHSVFRWNGQEPEAIPVRDLTKSDYIACPGFINIVEKDKSRVTLVSALKFMRENLNDYLVPVTKKHTCWGMRRNGFTPCQQRNFCQLGIIPLSLAIKWHDKYSYIRPAFAHTFHKNRIAISNKLLWLLGLIAAEGTVAIYQAKGGGVNYHVSISSHDKFIKQAMRIIEGDLGFHTTYMAPARNRPPSMIVNNKLFYIFLKYLQVGHNEIPGWVLCLPIKRLAWFLKGYWDGDGVKEKRQAYNRHFTCTTISIDMARRLTLALLRFGIMSSIHKYIGHIPPRTKQYPFYRIAAYGINSNPLKWKERASQSMNPNKTMFRQGDLAFVRVKSLTKYDIDTIVYDYSVPQAENFIAGDLIYCHNTIGRATVRNNHFVVERAITQALSAGYIKLHNPDPIREFMFRTDHVRAYLCALNNLKAIGQTINICTGEAVTIREMAERVASIVQEMIGKRVLIEFSAEPDRPSDIVKLQGSNLKAKELLGWAPQYTLDAGLRQAVKEWKEVLNL